MQWANSPARFGAVAKLLHWTTAALFIAAYLLVYTVTLILGHDHPYRPPVLKLHFSMGLLVGFLVLPRILWRVLNVQPLPLDDRKIEHRMAEVAHLALYAVMLVMPVTGYLGTGVPSSVGFFELPSFRDTAAFAWLGNMLDITWQQFEQSVDTVHHFVGKWVAWAIVLLHVAAALFHHLVRKDDVLRRMLPERHRDRESR
ncbi:MAG: cytochrome b [Alphaproteobacteria bacterium]|nr:cytochrome b [Alphaproteobacteria bacterium]